MISAFFLVGCTAVGKSAVAHRLAIDRGLAVLSADSMQVYRGMDIGTAKPSTAQRSEVVYHGLDLVEPNQLFSVKQYRSHAMTVLKDASRGGTEILVVGGSGLYVKSLTDGFADVPGAQPGARERWNRLLEEKGVPALQEALKEKSSVLYDDLKDKMNPRRLIRALEMAEVDVKSRPENWPKKGSFVPLVGLSMAPVELDSRIAARVSGMYDEGLLEEVRGLLERYPDLSDTAGQAIGYAEAIDGLQGKCSLKEAREKTVIRTRQLAKKQRTWFRGQASVDWIDIAGGMNVDDIAGQVWEKLEKNGAVHIAEECC